MKFYEVTTQFVLTGHVIGYDVMVITHQDLGRDDAGAAGAVSRPPRTRPSTTTPPSSARRKRTSLEFFKKRGQEGLHAGPQRLPDLRAEEVRRQVRQRVAEGRARAHQRASDVHVSLATARSSRASAFVLDAGWLAPSTQGNPAMPTFARRGSGCARRADDVAVALIAIMFVSFLLQIVFRYLLNQPLGWTDEVTVLCWVWVVLWGAAFVLSRPGRDPLRHRLRRWSRRGAPRRSRGVQPRAGRCSSRSRCRRPGTTWPS